MESSPENLYESHHRKNRAPGFSILKSERGQFIAQAIGTGKTVLDIGCRDGALTSYFVSGNEVTGVDIDRVALKKAQTDIKINAIFMDLYGNWAELDGKMFDVVVCGEVLEHLFHPETIMEKVAKHLKKDGQFIGSVPNAFSLKNRMRYLAGTKRHTPLSDPTHVNHFSASELHNSLAKYFDRVTVTGLGKHSFLAKKFPGTCAFDLMFVAKFL